MHPTCNINSLHHAIVANRDTYPASFDHHLARRDLPAAIETRSPRSVPMVVTARRVAGVVVRPVVTTMIARVNRRNIRRRQRNRAHVAPVAVLPSEEQQGGIIPTTARQHNNTRLGNIFFFFLPLQSDRYPVGHSSKFQAFAPLPLFPINTTQNKNTLSCLPLRWRLRFRDDRWLETGDACCLACGGLAEWSDDRFACPTMGWGGWITSAAEMVPGMKQTKSRNRMSPI